MAMSYFTCATQHTGPTTLRPIRSIGVSYNVLSFFFLLFFLLFFFAEAAFLPLRNDGETHSLTSDSSKVTLNSAIVSVPTKALNGVKGGKNEE